MQCCSNAPWCLNCHPVSCGRNCPCCPPKRVPRCICGCIPQPAAQCNRFPTVDTQFEIPPMCRGCCDCCCRPTCLKDCPSTIPKQIGGCSCGDCCCKNWLYCRPSCPCCGCCRSNRFRHCHKCPSYCSCYPPRCGSVGRRFE